MRKIGLLSIALIIALGCCGVGYASWTQTLEARGTVEVEECWIEYTDFDSNDSGEAEDPGYTKHVASTEVRIEDTTKSVWCWCFSVRNKLVVTVNNAYPSYQPTVTYWVMAVARRWYAKLDAIYINDNKLTPEQWGQPVDLGELMVTVDPPRTIPPCNSICPLDCNSEPGYITIHVEQDADPCDTYEFTVTMYYTFTCCP